jgi:hypothetical protein
MYKMSDKPDFKSLNLKAPELVLAMSRERQLEVFEYLKQLDKLQRESYSIAIEHLDTSFNIHKSNGFKEWKMKKQL